LQVTIYCDDTFIQQRPNPDNQNEMELYISMIGVSQTTYLHLCRLTTADQPNGQSGFITADSLICRSPDAEVNSFTSEYYQFIVICPEIHDLRASTLDRATTDLSGEDLYIDSDRTISSYLLHEFLHYENYNFSKPARYDSFRS
jgi:hypothetical protein